MLYFLSKRTVNFNAICRRILTAFHPFRMKIGRMNILSNFPKKDVVVMTYITSM